MVRRRRKRPGNPESPVGRRLPRPWEKLAHRTILKLLVPLGGHRNLLCTHYCDNDALMEYLEIPVPEAYDRAALRRSLTLRHRLAEALPAPVPETGPLARNLAWLAGRLGLDAAETALLRFAILMEQHPPVADAAGFVGRLNLRGTTQALARLLDLTEAAVARALSREGRLATVGLLALQERGPVRLPEKLALLEGLSDQMLCPSRRGPRSLFAGLCTPAVKPGLALADYPHLEEELRTVEAHLRTALAAHARGVNILFWGPPGVGKTEAARLLARRLGAEAHEISVGEADGSPFDGLHRLRAYKMSQAFLSHAERPLLLMDEAGDVLNIPSDVLEQGHMSRPGFKAWMLRTLETNEIPCIWIANTLHCDGGLLRRFDICQEFKVPPRPVRERILDRNLGKDAIPPELRRDILDHADIPPAWVSRAVRVVRSAMASDTGLDLGPGLHRLLSGQLATVGADPLPPARVAAPALPYRMDCLNADQDLARICEALAKSPHGRILLWGPPGTGKSQWGRTLAERLGRPLVVKRGDDLLGPFVGQTEALVGQAFAEASRSGAVLLIDEIDSFMADRSASSGPRWETSMVNQFLCETERYDGIFVATTNLLLEKLDPASLRRFDLKLKLDHLKPEAAWSLFQTAAGHLGFPAEPRHETAVKALRLATPGDLAAILRRSRFAPIEDSAALLKALQEEIAYKPEGRRRAVGFQSGGGSAANWT